MKTLSNRAVLAILAAVMSVLLAAAPLQQVVLQAQLHQPEYLRPTPCPKKPKILSLSALQHPKAVLQGKITSLSDHTRQALNNGIHALNKRWEKSKVVLGSTLFGKKVASQSSSFDGTEVPSAIKNEYIDSSESNFTGYLNRLQQRGLIILGRRCTELEQQTSGWVYDLNLKVYRKKETAFDLASGNRIETGRSEILVFRSGYDSDGKMFNYFSPLNYNPEELNSVEPDLKRLFGRRFLLDSEKIRIRNQQHARENDIQGLQTGQDLQLTEEQVNMIDCVIGHYFEFVNEKKELDAPQYRQALRGFYETEREIIRAKFPSIDFEQLPDLFFCFIHHYPLEEDFVRVNARGDIEKYTDQEGDRRDENPLNKVYAHKKPYAWLSYMNKYEDLDEIFYQPMIYEVCYHLFCRLSRPPAISITNDDIRNLADESVLLQHRFVERDKDMKRAVDKNYYIRFSRIKPVRNFLIPKVIASIRVL